MIQCNTRFVSVRSRACTKGNGENIYYAVILDVDTLITHSTCKRWTVLCIHKPYVVLVSLPLSWDRRCFFSPLFVSLSSINCLSSFVCNTWSHSLCHTCHSLRVCCSMISSPLLRYLSIFWLPNFLLFDFNAADITCNRYYAHCVANAALSTQLLPLVAFDFSS